MWIPATTTTDSWGRADDACTEGVSVTFACFNIWVCHLWATDQIWLCFCFRACCGQLHAAAGWRRVPLGRVREVGRREPQQGQGVHRERGPPPHPGQRQDRREECPLGSAAVRQPHRTEGGVPAHAQPHSDCWLAGGSPILGLLLRSGPRYHLCCQQCGDSQGTNTIMVNL